MPRRALPSFALRRVPLSLDITSRLLTGPTGSTVLTVSEAAVLRPFLNGRMLVSIGELRTAAFPTGEPSNPRHALRARMARLRAKLVEVGIPGTALRNWYQHAYTLLVDEIPQVVTGDRLAALAALLRSHPDQVAVARLDLWAPVPASRVKKEAHHAAAGCL